jgi:hypothetical protein
MVNGYESSPDEYEGNKMADVHTQFIIDGGCTHTVGYQLRYWRGGKALAICS